MKDERDITSPEETTESTPPVHKKHRYDWIAFIFCVLAAVFCWLYVMQSESPDNSETFTSISVEIIGSGELSSSAGMSVISGNGRVVDVVASGKRSELVKYTSADFRATVDVSDITEAGEHTLEVIIEPPAGIVVQSKTPGTIKVETDAKATVIVPVSVNIIKLQHDDTVAVGGAYAVPGSVTVSGPASVLEDIVEARIDVSLENKVESTETVIGPLVLVNKDGDTVEHAYITFSPQTAKAVIPVEPVSP